MPKEALKLSISEASDGSFYLNDMRVGGGICGYITRLAEVERIVKCVNLHDLLVARLEEALDELGQHGDPDYLVMERVTDAIEAAKE